MYQYSVRKNDRAADQLHLFRRTDKASNAEVPAAVSGAKTCNYHASSGSADDTARVEATLPAMLRFRMFAIACGYEDADDCDALIESLTERLPGLVVPS